MKFGIITKYWRHGASVALAVVLAMLGILFPVHIEIGPSPGSSIGINQGMFRITIGNKVNAQAANYTCDGINDDVEFQQALDALPDIGGQLLVLAGSYNFTDATTVTRAIPNVTILGIGASVIFSGDGSTPIFTAGDDNWLFSNFQTDAGGLEMGATNNWLWINVIIAGTLYPLEPTLTDINDLIDLVEADVAALEASLNQLNATVIQHGINISALEDDVAVLQGDLADVQSDLAAINTTVNYHSGNISALQSDVSALEGDMSVVQSNLAAINTTVNYHSGNISALQSDVSDLEGDVADFQSDLAAVNATVNYHSGNISDLQSAVSALEGDVSALQSDVSTLQGEVSALQDDLDGLTTTVNYHSGNISALQSSMTSLNNTLNWHTGNSTGVHGVTGTVLGTEDVNDTPTDGNTTNPISSNWAYDHANSNVTIAIIYVIDGGGSAITTGVKGFLEIPFACTVTGWTLTADQSGSIVIDVWKDTYANFPPTVADTIAGSEKPTLSSVQKNQDLSLSTWTTTISAGDHLAFNVDSASTVTRITLTIRATRTMP